VVSAPCRSFCLNFRSFFRTSFRRTIQNLLILVLASHTIFLLPSPAQNLPDIMETSGLKQPAAPEATHVSDAAASAPEQMSERKYLSREWLEGHGFTFSLQYRSDNFSNLRGGMDSTPTAAYLGSTDAALQFDLRKMMKIGRGKIVVTSQWLQGHTINDSEVGAAQRMSNLDAEPFCKVIEAYYADTYLHERLTVKLGRHDACRKAVSAISQNRFYRTLRHGGSSHCASPEAQDSRPSGGAGRCRRPFRRQPAQRS
jgi:carbohydrate-selective porin OprB